MRKTGVVSVSFRALAIEEVARLAGECGLDGIEWGGDVHVPPLDRGAIARAVRATADAGLTVLSYGSYCRLTDDQEFEPIVETARALGAPILRVWAGAKDVKDATDDDYRFVADRARALCRAASGLNVAFEFHAGTLTSTGESAKRILDLIDMPNMKTHWQPPMDLPEAKCLSDIACLAPQIANAHVFSWAHGERFPLAAHEDSWLKYFKALPESACATLEFVQNDDPANLKRDADALRAILTKCEENI